MVSFIIAGSETTGTALAGITYHLCKNPSTMKTLVSEIRTSFANSGAITVASATQLKYLNAVICEGLRIYPPFAAGNHRVAPKGGDMVDGRFVPEGVSHLPIIQMLFLIYIFQTQVFGYHYALYHSPKYFALPHEFHPERWLDTDERFAKDQLDGVRPFGLGPRGCIGQK